MSTEPEGPLKSSPELEVVSHTPEQDLDDEAQQTGEHPISVVSPLEYYVRQSKRQQRRRRSHHKIHVLRVALACVGGLLALVMVVAAVLLLSASGKNSRLAAQLQQAENELFKAQQSLQEMEQARDELVQGRNPAMRPLEFDQNLQVGRGYLRDILFTEITRGGETLYEYRVVMENTLLRTVRPDVKLMLFDEFGVEIGHTAFGASHDDGERKLDLGPGEIQSYTGTIVNGRGVEPSYFLVEVQ